MGCIGSKHAEVHPKAKAQHLPCPNPAAPEGSSNGRGCVGSQSPAVKPKSEPQHLPSPTPLPTPADSEDCSHARTQNASVPASSANGSQKLPPLCPPRQSREQLIPDPGVFGEVDDHVRKVSRTSPRSLQELGQALTAPFTQHTLQLRALYVWCALNIRYDTDSYFSGCSSSSDASSVLKTGKAVCQGYSQLLEALCKVAGIPCLVVSGIAKGYSHDPETVYTVHTKTNHAWNLVLLQGEWRPLESTWGAGHVDASGQFVPQFKDRWFLTDPEEFVLQHFPLMNRDLRESAPYQLLECPLTIQQFSAHVKLEETAHALDLQCLTHQQTIIDVIRDVTIKVKANRQPLEAMKVTLTERGSAAQVKAGSHVLTSLDDAGTCVIYVRPPRVATYLLKVMGRGKEQEPSKLHALVTYVIRCREAQASMEPYPDKDSLWGLQNPTATDCGIGMDNPLNASSTPFLFSAKNSEVTVPLRLSGYVALKARLTHARAKDKDLEAFTFIEYAEPGARLTARLSEPGYYLLRVFASHPAKELLHPVADFLLFSQKEGSCRPFPKVYSTAHKAGVRLLWPMQGTIPKGRATLYRVWAPSLGKLKVAGQRMALKDQGVWEAEVTPAEGKSDVSIFGAEDKDATSLPALFQFSVAEC